MLGISTKKMFRLSSTWPCTGKALVILNPAKNLYKAFTPTLVIIVVGETHLRFLFAMYRKLLWKLWFSKTDTIAIMRGFQADSVKVAEDIPLKTAFCRFHDNDYNECAVWENIFNVFLSQNPVLTRNLHGKFPALHCNEVLENYFSK